MRLDHLSYACTTAEIADVIQRIGSDLGGTFVDGGRHPSFGTRNFILPLAGGSYIEVVSALDHPSADKAPFGRAVQQAAADGGGWLTWVVAVTDIRPIEQRLGRASRPGRRVRPDGVELQWQQIGVLDVMDDPQLPFFISWESAAEFHPSSGSDDIRISALDICGESDRICAFLDAPLDHPLDDITVNWVLADDPGIQAVWFDTPQGAVRID
jgi:hypothetical protein